MKKLNIKNNSDDNLYIKNAKEKADKLKYNFMLLQKDFWGFTTATFIEYK